MSQQNYQDALAEAREQYQKEVEKFKAKYPNEEIMLFEDWLAELTNKHR